MDTTLCTTAFWVKQTETTLEHTKGKQKKKATPSHNTRTKRILLQQAFKDQANEGEVESCC